MQTANKPYLRILKLELRETKDIFKDKLNLANKTGQLRANGVLFFGLKNIFLKNGKKSVVYFFEKNQKFSS